MAATLLLVDVSNLVHRIYHATASSGVGEDKLFNFARARLRKSLAGLIRDVDPVRFVAAFDGPPGSFRDELMGDYKGGRAEKAPILQQLLDAAPEVFAELGAECLYSPNHEADDVVATVADQCVAVGGWRVIIVSQDGDLLSCIFDAGGGEGVFVLRHHAGSYQLWGEEEVLSAKKYGVPPSRIAVFKALAGDASDAIKGVPGVGPVAARRWATRYPNIKRLYLALQNTPLEFTKTERKRLEEFGLEAALAVEKVVRLVRNAPLKKLT